MGRHKQWRKIAKKMRRKTIRSTWAKKRDALEKEEEEKRKMSPNYEKRIAEETALQIAAKEAEMKELEEKLKKWEEEEERVREETKLRDALLKDLAEQSEKKRIEKVEAEKQLVEEEEEKKRRITDSLNHFAAGVIDVLPDDMLVPSETQPGKEICPFFHKVAACRFWDTCSRNHIRPAVSKVLLFPGFYTHCSMSHIGHAEYDTDMSLEYDEKETYSHFLEFYQDIRSEFEKYGHLTHLFVCSNRELHLRGNVYVSYVTERETMNAYLKFNGRYYAGKVISCLFVNIPTWKSAICGLYFKQKCPKGDACNFLHVFKDPGPPFYKPNQDRNSPEEWRWSVSPEQDKLNGHEAINENVRGGNRSNPRRRSSSSLHRSSRSSERNDECNNKSHHRRSKSKENSRNSCVTHYHTFKRRSVEEDRHSEKANRRNRSRDRYNSSSSNKRSRDKSSNRRTNEKESRNYVKRKSSSSQRDREQNNFKRYKHESSTNKNITKKNDKKRNRSSISSITSSSSTETESSSSDNETSSMNVRQPNGN